MSDPTLPPGIGAELAGLRAALAAKEAALAAVEAALATSESTLAAARTAHAAEIAALKKSAGDAAAAAAAQLAAAQAETAAAHAACARALADRVALAAKWDDMARQLAAAQAALAAAGRPPAFDAARMRAVTRYQTPDGTCHDTPADAARHLAIGDAVARGAIPYTQAARLVDAGLIRVEPVPLALSGRLSAALSGRF